MWKNSGEMLRIRSLFLLVLVAVKISSSADAEVSTGATKDDGKVILDGAVSSTISPTSDTGTAAEKPVTSRSTRFSTQNTMKVTKMTSTSAKKQGDSKKKANKVTTVNVTTKTSTTILVATTSKPSVKDLLKKGIKGSHATTIIESTKGESSLPSSTTAGEKAVTSVPVIAEVAKISELPKKETPKDAVQKELEASTTIPSTNGGVQFTSVPTTTEIGNFPAVIGKKKITYETTTPKMHSTTKMKSNKESPTSKPNQLKNYLKSVSKENKTEAVANLSSTSTTQTIALFKMVPFGADFEPQKVKGNPEKILQMNPFSRARIIEGACIAVICVLGFIAVVVLLVMYFKAHTHNRKRSKRASQPHEIEGLMENKDVSV